MSFGDFIDGATQLPRNIVGGAAIALGADRQSTNDFLGLDQHPNADGMIEEIKSNPSKFVGELAMYALLPTHLFKVHKRLSKRFQSKKHSDTYNKNINTVAGGLSMAGTMGVYGGAEELAKAQVEDRSSHAMKTAVVDASLAIGVGALYKTAIIGSEAIKNRALKSKYIQNIFKDAGFSQKDIPDLDNMTYADKVATMRNLDKQIESSSNALRGAALSAQPHAKFGMFKDTPIFDQLFNRHVQPANIDKIKLDTHRLANRKAKNMPNATTELDKLKIAADNHEAITGQVSRAFNSLATAVREAVPDKARRELILKSLDVNGFKYIGQLTKGERAVAKRVRRGLDDIGKAALKSGLIKNLRENYVPHFTKDMDATTSLEDMVGKRSHISKRTDRGKQRTDTRELADKNYVTLDIAEALDLYGQQLGRAHASGWLMRDIPEVKADEAGAMLKLATSKSDPKYVIDVVSHPTVLAKAMKDLGISRNIRREVEYNNHDEYHDHYMLPHEKEKKKAMIDAEFKKAYDEAIKKLKIEVHPDMKPTLDMLFRTADVNDMLKKATVINAVSKRSLIFGSLFHFNALSENVLFAGAGGIGASLKGAATGFVVSGFNPLGAAIGASLGAGVQSLIKTKHISDAMRHGEYGDRYDFFLRYVDIKPPRDVDNDAFFEGLSGIQSMIDKYVPSNTAKGILKKGTRAVGGINKVIDVLMWDRLMSGAKLTVVERTFEELVHKNSLLPKIEQMSQHELGKIAGQFTNDAFGGQNWRRLADSIEGKWGHKWAAAMATQEGKVWTNLVMFAPDWTISNIRILAMAFPGINKSKLSRQIYQRYAIRAAIYYSIVGAAIQQMLTGTNIWDNEDPTRLDLGNGQTMTFSKQLSEPFKWVLDPIHEVTIKQSSLLKGVEEQLTNQQYIGAGGHSPEIRSDDSTGLDKIGGSLVVAGSHFAPIFAQDIGRNGVEGVYGFFGHPVYGSIRNYPKQGSGEVLKEA